MIYKRGDIVVVRFPFVLKEETQKQKGRPALVISNHKVKKRYKDIILAAITSHIPTTTMEAEVILEPGGLTGLLKRSLLRSDFIMTIPEELVSRKIGELPEELVSEVEKRLRIIFGIQ